jgi:hypothetical protein
LSEKNDVLVAGYHAVYVCPNDLAAFKETQIGYEQP